MARWIRWMRLGAIAISDQGLISGTNFALNIILARYLTPAAYGCFAIAFAAYLLAVVAHEALVLEPMAVFASSLQLIEQRRYVGVLLRWHLIAVVPIVLIVGTILYRIETVAPNLQLASGLLAAAFAIPCILPFWLIRRAIYLRPDSKIGPVVALLYCGLTFTGLALLNVFHLLSSVTPFLLLASVAAICTAVTSFLVKPILERAPEDIHIARQHWRYGRWALGSQALTWAPMNLLVWLIGAWHGMDQAGEIKALFNLSMPLQQLHSALQLNLLPHTARTYSRKGWQYVRSNVRWIALLFTAISLCYWGPLWAVSSHVIHLLYGGKYSQTVDFIPLLAITSLASAIASGPIIGFRAINRPSAVLITYLAMNALAVVLSIPAIWLDGMQGALAALAFSGGISVFVALALVRHISKQQILSRM